MGPMGNGKTTLVKEGIAKMINRPFEFISLGGATDACYLMGIPTHMRVQYQVKLWIL